MVLALFEMPLKKKKKLNRKSKVWRICQQGIPLPPSPRCDLHQLALWLKAPLLLFHKPCLIYFLSKKNLCAAFKLTRLSKTTSWPLSWGSKTTKFWGCEGPARVSGSQQQHLAGWRTGRYIPQGDSFYCAA